MTDTYRPDPAPPGPPGGWHPPQWYTQPPSPPSNGLATGGFVTALVGAVLALIPLVGIVSWLICPVGLVLSVVGLVMAGGRGGVGRGLGIAGVALAVVGLVVCSLYAAAFTGALRALPTTSSSAAGSGSDSSTAVPGQYTSGTYEVGGFAGEIPAGRYTAAPGSSHCYYARLSNLGGGVDSIIANDNELNGGPMIVEIQSSDAAFQISGDCTFTRQ
jgi:hypothetical protein